MALVHRHNCKTGWLGWDWGDRIHILLVDDQVKNWLGWGNQIHLLLVDDQVQNWWKSKSNLPSIGWWPSQKLIKTEIERAERPEWNIAAAAAAEFIKLNALSIWEFLF